MYPPRVNLDREHWSLTTEHEPQQEEFYALNVDVVDFIENNSYGITQELCAVNEYQFTH